MQIYDPIDDDTPTGRKVLVRDEEGKLHVMLTRSDVWRGADGQTWVTVQGTRSDEVDRVPTADVFLFPTE